MEVLKYKVIKSEEQYWAYCSILEVMVANHSDDFLEDEIELLTILVEKWDSEHTTFTALDPVEMLKALMDENKVKASQIADIADVGKSTISEILHYRKGFSKDIIRKLALHFKVTQEAFNRPYQLKQNPKGGEQKMVSSTKRKPVSTN